MQIVFNSSHLSFRLLAQLVLCFVIGESFELSQQRRHFAVRGLAGLVFTNHIREGGKVGASKVFATAFIIQRAAMRANNSPRRHQRMTTEGKRIVSTPTVSRVITSFQTRPAFLQSEFAGIIQTSFWRHSLCRPGIVASTKRGIGPIAVPGLRQMGSRS